MPNPNTPIGTCVCPFKGCDLVVPVFRYRAKNPERKGHHRYAGKLYLRCPTHGKSEDQEWILEHATIDGPPQPEPEPAATEPEPSPPPEPAAIEPEPEPVTDDKSGWGFFE